MKTLNKQKGFALLLFVTVLATAATTLAVKALNNNGNVRIDRDKITAAALAQAKDALIGRAVADANRPGSLPCPDMLTNITGNVPNDGIADLFNGNDCPSYIGRLPWKTLDLPDLRDGYGEHLWYVLSRNFRDDNSAEPINSDTKGTLTVYLTDLSLFTNQSVAIIFSPGNVLAAQNRSTSNVISNYLDYSNCPGSNCRDNTGQYVPFGTFYAGPVLDSNRNTLLNDKISVIQTKDIIPTVEKRAAKEISELLQTYFLVNGYYPYPAKYNDCDPNNGNHCRGDNDVCRGRIPRSEAYGNANWNMPNWIIDNQWYREIYYSVGKASLQSSAGLSCGNTLSVTGLGSVRAVFLTPGSPIGTVNRPSNTLSDYLEDTENRDGWSGGANDTYIIPTAPALDRDRLISLP